MLEKTLIAALGAAALALPASAAALPSPDDHPGAGNPGPPDLSGLVPDHPGADDHPGPADHPTADEHPGGQGAAAQNPKVSYVFKGTYNADGSVAVTKGNNHVRKADLVEEDVEFDLTDAKLTVADTNADGAQDLSDVQTGDSVIVIARLPKSDPGGGPYSARRLVDQTHEDEDETPAA